MITWAQILGLNEEHVQVLANDDRHKLQPEVINAFSKMQKAAALDGHDLQLVSSYRSFERQANIWNRKFKGELALNNIQGQQIDPERLNDHEKMHAILLWSALPGGSRHHWGTDFDVYDRTKVVNTGTVFELITQEYEGTGPCAELSKWLQENAKNYGFERPYAQYVGGVAAEPWHLSFMPLASEIVRAFSVDLLKQQLVESEILGLDSVLPHINALFERYTLNKGNRC